MTLFWSVPLNLSKTARPYLVSSPYAYSYEVDRNSPERMIESNPFILEQSNTSDKIKETKILGAEITGKIDGLFNAFSCDNSKIIVISDPYFVNSLMTGYNGGNYGDYRNFDFITNTLLKLNNEEELSELQAKNKNDSSLYKISDQERFKKYTLISYFILFLLIPLLLLLSALLLMISKGLSCNRKIKKLQQEKR